MAHHETLGLLLVRKGIIERSQLYDALRLQRQRGQLLGTCLVELGYVAPQEMLALLSEQLGIPTVPPGALAQPDGVEQFGGEWVRKHRVVPFRWDDEGLHVAVADGLALGRLSKLEVLIGTPVLAYAALERDLSAWLQPSDFPQDLRPPRKSPVPEVVGIAQEVLVKVEGAQQVERAHFLDSMAALHDCASGAAMCSHVAAALLNYFPRVGVILKGKEEAQLVALGGALPKEIFTGAAVAGLCAQICEQTDVRYGLPHETAKEVLQASGAPNAKAVLLASSVPQAGPAIFMWADHGDQDEVYEELDDVELLVKEAEIALSALGNLD